MTDHKYLVDQITKHVRYILSEATYGDSSFQHVYIGINWFDGGEPRIDYRYVKGDRDTLHLTPEDYEEEGK